MLEKVKLSHCHSQLCAVHVAGVPVSPDIVLRTSFTSIASWLNSQQAINGSDTPDGPQAMDTDAAAASAVASASDANATGGSDMTAAQDEIIKKVMQEFVFHSSAHAVDAGYLVHVNLCAQHHDQVAIVLICSSAQGSQTCTVAHRFAP